MPEDFTIRVHDEAWGWGSAVEEFRRTDAAHALACDVFHAELVALRAKSFGRLAVPPTDAMPWPPVTDFKDPRVEAAVLASTEYTEAYAVVAAAFSAVHTARARLLALSGRF